MLRTSLLETDEKPPAAELADGAIDVIEGATAEDAVARVHATHGPQARIVEARRHRRGGIGGFFATEVVQLHIAPAEPSPGSAAVPPSPAPEPRPPESRVPDLQVPDLRASASPAAEPPAPSVRPDTEPSAVDRLLVGADELPETVDFATFLRRQMADEAARPATPDAGPAPRPVAPAAPSAESPAAGGPAPSVAAPAPSVAAPAPSPESPAAVAPAPAESSEPARQPVSVMAGPPWSVNTLLHLGLPAELVRSLDLDDTADDLAWTTALTAAVAGLCGPVPSGPALLVGPRADDLATAVAAPTARSRMWFDALSDGRWIHLVVGGAGWREQLDCGPRVVSWADPADLPEALRCASELGLTLGYGPLGGVVRRARPLDVVLAIRAQVDRR